MDVKPEKEFVVHGLQIIFHFKPITQMAYKKLEKPAGLVEAKTRLQAMQNIDTKESAPVEYGHTGDPVNATSLDTSRILRMISPRTTNICRMRMQSKIKFNKE